VQKELLCSDWIHDCLMLALA